jgi:hypothetical protein
LKLEKEPSQTEPTNHRLPWKITKKAQEKERGKKKQRERERESYFWVLFEQTQKWFYREKEPGKGFIEIQTEWDQEWAIQSEITVLPTVRPVDEYNFGDVTDRNLHGCHV